MKEENKEEPKQQPIILDVDNEGAPKRKRGRPKKVDLPLVINDLDIDSADYSQNQNIILSKPKKELLVNRIIKEMMAGKTTNQIVNLFQQEFKIQMRKTKYLIHEANRVILEYTEDERAILKEKNHALLLDLYQKNIEKDDLREARTVLEVINKMYGMNAADKLEVSQSIIKFEFDLGEEKNNEDEHKLIDMEDTEYTEENEQTTDPDTETTEE